MKVDLYVMGQYRGQIEVGENSLVARAARGDLFGALTKTQEMVDELNKIPGVEASFGTET